MMAQKTFPLSIAWLPFLQRTGFYTPLLKEALHVATEAHHDQLRKDGTPYISHPLAVARRCQQLYQDEQLTAAALLHDVIEDCPQYNFSQLQTHFGSQVCFLVDGVTKTTLELFDDPSLHFEHHREKLLWCGLEDIRVWLLKLADREHNLATIQAQPKKAQLRIMLDTLLWYLPLARLLGTEHSTDITRLHRHCFHRILTQGLMTPTALMNHLFAEGSSTIQELAIDHRLPALEWVNGTWEGLQQPWSPQHQQLYALCQYTLSQHTFFPIGYSLPLAPKILSV